ncbi:Uncharacterised protein [Mycobacteroides abscessus subsp. abscessus]|nr:Uncharacterised protein [Mycobacteroides abscessus subsp. abscessus]
MQLAITDHQPGRDAADQFDRDDGAVVAAHPAVEVVRVAVENGAVQRYRVPVRGAATRGGGEIGDVHAGPPDDRTGCGAVTDDICLVRA